jgi:beta-mannosidase
MDYFGRWKALHHYARRFFRDVLVSPHEQDGRINIHLVSDRTAPVPAELRVTLRDFAGRVLFERREDVQIPPLSSSVRMSLTKSELLKGRDPRSVFLDCELTEKGAAMRRNAATERGAAVSGNRLFFAPFKELRLAAPGIVTNVEPHGRAFRVRLRADSLARGVHLSAGPLDGSFSDNFFDLLPGGEVSVNFFPRRAASLADLRRHLRVRSLADAFTKAAAPASSAR